MKFIQTLLCFSFCAVSFAQSCYWQQRVKYFMDIDMDVNTHRLVGKQRIILYNNSPDSLFQVFYHLYFNAFQPNSMMDIQSRTVTDPDKRIADRIQKLQPSEIGYQNVRSLLHNGDSLSYEVRETILKVNLRRPIPPNHVDTFDMEFEAQVPIQVRRSGRDNAEGVRYSMTQWYPKMCNYDGQGWHSNPYIGREFYGIWGDFDVKINIDKTFILGGTGYVQNPLEVGYGYEQIGEKINYGTKEKLRWHFFAPNVHDFAWAADPDFIHDVVEVNDSLNFHFLYQDDPEHKNTWRRVQPEIIRAFKFAQLNYGVYPYKQYSFIQGGDGGMEYQMATLITGKRAYGSLLGVMVHEMMHAWYQGLLATNESLYAWMDEGFTSYASEIIMANLPSLEKPKGSPHDASYKSYFNLQNQGFEEPLSTHADHYLSNTAYGVGVYSKGAVFLAQLYYLIGQQDFERTLHEYFKQWKFKHPTPNDFIRVVEKITKLEFDWYKEHWVNTINFIDYGVKKAVAGEKPNQTRIVLERIGRIPMPIELIINYEDPKTGQVKEKFVYIPLDLMQGVKNDDFAYSAKREIAPIWYWAHPTYELILEDTPFANIQKISIDPSLRMADIKKDNNVLKLK